MVDSCFIVYSPCWDHCRVHNFMDNNLSGVGSAHLNCRTLKKAVTVLENIAVGE